MRSAKRTRQYKIIAAIIFGLLLAVPGLQIARLYKSVNPAGYELNKQINDRNDAFAKANPFGFTDKVRAPKKPKGVYRIAVAGDSFIWGDGLPYEKVWSHKLERKLLDRYDSVEIMSWGKCGWSTLDEFNFFKQHGKDYDIDLLIIGWVDNDPDVGKIKQVFYTDAKKAYPVRYFFSPALAQSQLNQDNIDSGLAWWKGIYSPANLKDYQVVLNDFKQYLDQNHVQSVMVITTSAFWDGGLKRINTIKPMILQAGFNCLDTYGPAQKKLGHYTSEQLQANPVNQHPGDIMTEEISDEVLAYLQQNGYLKNLPVKSK